MFYVYQITNNINGKKYIGAHATDDVDDGYMGSGVLLKRPSKNTELKTFQRSSFQYIRQWKICMLKRLNS